MCDSCRKELGSPVPRLGTSRLQSAPQSCASLSLDAAGLGSWWFWAGHRGRRFWPGRAGPSLFRVLAFCPARVTECWIQLTMTGTWVSTAMWTYRAGVCLSVVRGSCTPGPLSLKVLQGGVGGPEGIPSWCPHWQQASEREAGVVGVEGTVHPRSSGRVGVPG